MPLTTTLSVDHSITYTSDDRTVQFPLGPGQVTHQVSAHVVTRAVKVLTHSNLGGGSAALQTLIPPGWGDGGCPYHHNRGHLIGNALGGPGNEAPNLVTLTAGTNHPFMYDYENALKAYVQGPGASSGVEYTVECEYGIQYYSLTMGFTVPGASGNPFCLFPAPAGLWLSAKLNGKTPLSLGDLCPGVDLGAAAAYPRLWVPNGGYKQYTGVTHIANSCWAADSTTMATIQPGAKAYAHHLQHI